MTDEGVEFEERELFKPRSHMNLVSILRWTEWSCVSGQ